MSALSAPERAALIDRLQQALVALEAGDETTWRSHVDALAAARTQPLVKGLSRLARELAQALGELPPADHPGANELDDACARLDHVVTTTEQATHRTLDLIEQSRAISEQLRTGLDAPHQLELLATLRLNLQEMALAQSYQDITGQTVRRVAGIVRRVHEGFAALGLPPQQRGATPDNHLAGPALAGIDRHGVSQNDADALLSDLGL